MATVVEQNDVTVINTDIYPAFGQLFDKNNNTTSNYLIGTHSFDSNNRTITLPVVVNSNQVYIAQTSGVDFTREIIENFGPLRSTIKKIYVMNMSPNAIFYNVTILPYSLTGKAKVEISTDGAVWTSNAITIPVWNIREIKEFYIRVSVQNSQQSRDSIGLAFNYSSSFGQTSYSLNPSGFSWFPYGGTRRALCFPLDTSTALMTGVYSGTVELCFVNFSQRTSSRLSSASFTRYFPAIAMSYDKRYFLFGNRVFDTRTRNTVLTLQTPPLSDTNAFFTQDGKYLIYIATNELRVVSIPSGDLVARYTNFNVPGLQRNVAIYATAPDDIWFFTGSAFIKFDPMNPTVNPSLLTTSTLISSYWLDEKNLAFICHDNHAGLLLNTDTMSCRFFNLGFRSTVTANSEHVANQFQEGTLLFNYTRTIFSPTAALTQLPSSLSDYSFLTNRFLCYSSLYWYCALI
ncbi:MAG: hypothetical protein QXE80_03380 [Pyrobaculum sp.]